MGFRVWGLGLLGLSVHRVEGLGGLGSRGLLEIWDRGLLLHLQEEEGVLGFRVCGLGFACDTVYLQSDQSPLWCWDCFLLACFYALLKGPCT